MDLRIILQTNFDEMIVANYQKWGNQGSMPKVGVRIIHGNIEILSELNKTQGAYYTWGHIIHGNLQ